MTKMQDIIVSNPSDFKKKMAELSALMRKAEKDALTDSELDYMDRLSDALLDYQEARLAGTQYAIKLG